MFRVSGLLSNQGEKSIDLYVIRVPLRKKVLKYGTPKPRFRVYRSTSGRFQVSSCVKCSAPLFHPGFRV